jgi:hypothetical protein
MNSNRMNSLFSDDKSDPENQRILSSLETIDDDCDRHGIVLVRIDDPAYATSHGIDKTPTLVYFENGIPNIYGGRLRKHQMPGGKYCI